jgi:aminoglycoside phosphotransferase (APT) family kinase protein
MALTDDIAARTSRALARDWPEVALVELTQFTSGASSLTYAARLRGAPAERVGVKVAPPGLAPVRNRDVLRQARLLQHLAGHPIVRVPQVFVCDAGDPPAVPPMFVMSFEAGDSVEPLQLPADVAPAIIRSRALQAARMLGALHCVDTSSLAEEPVTAQDEVARWQRALATVPSDISRSDLDPSKLLLSGVPVPEQPALSHGDWRLGNTLCVDGEIRAVIDWEIWSLGDPRVDLGWFLMECDSAHPSAIAGAESGMPSIAELVAAYESSRGAPVVDLAWFRALAAFKQAAVIGLIAKNSRKRGDPLEPIAERMATQLPDLLSWADSFLQPPSA